MSKISDQVLRNEETKMKYMFKFMDHLYDMFPQPTLSDEDINRMESDQQRPLPSSKQIISEQPQNNINYNNPIGA